MKKFALVLFFSSFSAVAFSQNNNPAATNSRESFQEFRNRVMNNYNEFRNTILEHYADFLNGEWHEYESLNGLKRDETPKPEEAPRVDLPNIPVLPPKPTQPEQPSLADNNSPSKEKPAEEKKGEKPEEKSEQPVLATKEPEKPNTTPIPPTPLLAENKPETPETEKPTEEKPEKNITLPSKPATTPTKPSEPTTPAKPTTPAEPTKPTAPTKPSTPTTPAKPTTPAEPTKPTAPTKPSTPTTPTKPSSVKPTTPSLTLPPSSKNKFDFEFYEIPMEMADIDFSIANHLASPSDFSSQWKNLEADKVGDRLVPAIKKAIDEIGFNDYLTYKFLESYVNAKFPKVNNSSKMALVHYLLVHLGYDARIAVTGKGTPLLLIPFKQTVYGKSYLTLNNMRYYLFPPEGYDISTVFSEKVMTCQLPSDIDTGAKFDLVLSELNIPMKPKSFDLEYGPVHLTGEMNENLIPILYKYPQMPIEDYAKSNLQPDLRNKLTQQIKEQIGGMDGDEGVEALLHFTQNVFQYATDDNYHGFEKPYFLEETLFYPKNDCEDRAIFYTYFLWNALGREAQLVSFPGHEAATVVLKNPRGGTFYNTDGKTFYISDPTYIGASTGMVMPSYTNVKPEVDYTYSKK